MILTIQLDDVVIKYMMIKLTRKYEIHLYFFIVYKFSELISLILIFNYFLVEYNCKLFTANRGWRE